MTHNVKKILSVVLSLSLVILLFPAYSESSSWDCPECGRTGNTGNYCGGCAHPAPWIESTETVSPEPTITHSVTSPTSVKVGDIVRFGHYEQDGNKKNGAESIDWYVLDFDSQGVLLISMYSLDARVFHTSNAAVNWESSSLRKWLNNDFVNSAFSNEERKHIVDSRVSPAKDVHKEKILDQGNETIDKVFLLSRGEWYEDYRNVLWDEEYDSRSFKTGMIPMCAPATPQAGKNAGEHLWEDWWLRGETYDKTSSYPYSNMGVGSGYCPHQVPLTSKYGVRPVIRVESVDWLETNKVSLVYSDFQYSIMDDNTVRIDKYLGNGSTVTIPETIDGRKITSIGINAFLNQTNLERVILPDSITIINAYAFKNCKKLSSISLPSNITSIKCYTFWGCTNLSEVSIPNGVVEICYCAFKECSSLKSLIIPKTVTYIDTYAFADCPNLKTERK